RGHVCLVDELRDSTGRRGVGRGGALLLRLGGRVLARVQPPRDQAAGDDGQPPPHRQRADFVGEDVFLAARRGLRRLIAHPRAFPSSLKNAISATTNTSR